jgi:hypothetical protein
MNIETDLKGKLQMVRRENWHSIGSDNMSKVLELAMTTIS